MGKFAWDVRETEAYKGIMKLFEETTVSQSVTRARLYEIRDEVDSLIEALNDPRKK